jgi:hypothetical protein
MGISVNRGRPNRYCEMCDHWVKHSVCPECGLDTIREASDRDYLDDAHERAAARARLDDFERTGGKDWT